MPFKSEKQRKWMHANEPEMADKWEKEEESVNEAKGVEVARRVTLNLPDKKTGMDMETAKKILDIDAAYSRTPSLQKQFRKMEVKKMLKMMKNYYWEALDKKLYDIIIEQTKRDYKAEYKKYGSSTKAKKYRAELNKYNRQKGTYGNGDGKDASHKGGKIVGFEAESKNRGRAEKSRLKKEARAILEADFTDDTLASRIKHWSKQHKGTGIGYGHVLGHLAVHMKEMGWNKSYKEVARIAVELGKKKKVESANEAVDKIDIIKKQFPWAKGKMIDAIKMMIEMDADGLAGILKNMKKNPKAFKQFVKDISKMRGMNESGLQYRMGVKRYGKDGMKKIQSAAGSGADHAEIGAIKDKYDKKKKKKKKESVNEELQNSQGEQIDFKRGDIVKDINPDCPHVGSEGEVTKVGNGTITFKVTNNGKRYKEGDELEKTVNQMVKLKESIIKDLLIDMIREELEKYEGGYSKKWNKQRKKNAEVLGYKLSGKNDIKESAVSFWQDMFRPGPIPKKYINQLIKKKGELPSKSHIKSIYKDNGNPSSSELAKSWKLLTKEKYVRAASGMWRWNADFTGWESVNEALKSKSNVVKLAGAVLSNMEDMYDEQKNPEKAVKAFGTMIKNSLERISRMNVKPHPQYDYSGRTHPMIKDEKSHLKFLKDYKMLTKKMILLIKALINKPSKAGIVKLWKYYQSSDYSEMTSVIATGDFGNNHIIESVNEGVSTILIKKAVDIAKKMSGNMTGAVKKIEKIKKGLSKQIEVEDALRTANESINYDKWVNEGFDKYSLNNLLDSKLKKRLERTINIIGGKVDAVGDDYIKFRIGSMDLAKLPSVITKLDRNKNVWIGDRRKTNVWDRKQNIDKLNEGSTIPSAGAKAHVDDGPRYWWGDRDSYESHQDKIAGKLGWEVVDWIMNKNTKMWGNSDPKSTDYAGKFDINLYKGKDVDPGGPTGAVSYAPTGMTGKKGGTQVFEVDNMAKGFSLWEDHIKFVLKNLGWEIIDYMGAEGVLMNTVPEKDHPDDTPHDRKSEKGKVTEAMTVTPPAYSSSEAQKHVDRDVTIMSRFIGKASQQVIKTMMDGVKSGKYDAMDLQRGFQYGPVKRTHFGEMPFIQQLWRKVRDGFRRYSKDRKLR